MRFDTVNQKKRCYSIFKGKYAVTLEKNRMRQGILLL